MVAGARIPEREATQRIQSLADDLCARAQTLMRQSLPGRKLDDLGVTMHALATWWDVLAVAKASGKFDAAKLAEVEKFMHDPDGWSKAYGGAAKAAG